MDIAALQQAGSLYAAEEAAAQKEIDKVWKWTYKDPETGELVTGSGPLNRDEYKELVKKLPGVTISPIAVSKSAGKAENFLWNGQTVSAIPGTPRYEQLVAGGAIRLGEVSSEAAFKTEAFTVARDIELKDKDGNVIARYGRGQPLNLTQLEKRQFLAAAGPDALVPFEKPRDRIVVDGVVIEVNNAAQNVKDRYKEVYKSDISEIKNVNGQLVLVDKNNPSKTKVLFGGGADQGKGEFRIIKDTGTGTETYVDISLPAGRAAVAKASAANADAERNVFEVRTVPSEQQKVAAPYAVKGEDGVMKVVLSYDGGRTYLDNTGTSRNIPTEGSTRLSDTIAFDVLDKLRVQNMAGEQLRQMDEAYIGSTVRGGDRGKPTNLSASDSRVVRDAMSAARNATGPYAGFAAALDNTFAGAIPVARKAFQDTQANRQFLRGVTILGRSALVVNPRFPVAELEKVGELFPNPDKFFRNPETEANKFIELKNLALQQKARNLSELAAGRQSREVVAQIFANNYEIDRLLSLLGTVPSNLGVDNQDVINALQRTIKRNVQKPTEGSGE